MIEVNRSLKGLKYTQKWFFNKVDFFDCMKITVYKQIHIDLITSPFFIKKYSYTLHSDLSLNEEEILEKFSSTVRNEIRRAEREGSIFNHVESKENFMHFYNEFASQRGISGISMEKLNSYGNNLRLTSTTKDGVITSAHSYLVDLDNKKVRFLHGGTSRFSESIDRNMIARSNKFLHFKNFMSFKELGFIIYDWGGIAYETKDKGLMGINKFKKSFGGELIKEKDLYSILYYIYLKTFK